jgi:hypothetical protein
MRLLLKLILWLLFLSPFVLGLLFWLALSDTPLVSEQPSLSRDDMLRAKAIVKQHKEQQSGDRPLHLVLSERDLELAGTYLLWHLTESGLKIDIRDDLLEARATLRIPGFPSRPYLNLQLQLRDQQGKPNLVHLQINDYVVPQSVSKQLLAELLIRLYRTDEYRLARSIVDELHLQDKQLALQYNWTPELARQARATFLKEPQQARQAYRSALRRLLQEEQARRLSLSKVLPPLFELAQQRSQEADPLSENKALLSVLGYWASSDRTLATELLGKDAGPPLRFNGRLHNRRDLARHFLTTAALVANTGDTLADIAGTFKEVADADKGSGFSFVDLAADRAGIRFGKAATASANQARRIQRLVAAGISEGDIMPDVGELSEGIDLERFKKDFGDLDSPVYRNALRHIDKQIDQCRLYASPEPPDTSP